MADDPVTTGAKPESTSMGNQNVSRSSPAGDRNLGSGHPVSPGPQTAASPATGGGAKRAIFAVAGVIALIAAAIWGISFWRYSSMHVTTDDAYVTGDLVNVSPVINGTLVDLTVDE